MLKIDSECGVIHTDNQWLNRAIVAEVMEQDCYRLKKIAKIFHPRTMFDIGMGHGQVAMLARKLWPEIAVTGFEYSPDIASAARLNVPDANVVVAEVGYGLRGHQLVGRYGYADLLSCDCEGGEVPFFYDLHVTGQLDHFGVIVGEWHHRPAVELLRSCLAAKYHFLRVDPPQGAGEWSYFFAVKRGLEFQNAIMEGLGIPPDAA